jgi:hypothetical protein
VPLGVHPILTNNFLAASEIDNKHSPFFFGRSRTSLRYAKRQIKQIKKNISTNRSHCQSTLNPLFNMHP